MLPKVIGRLHNREQLASGSGDDLKVGEQGAAKGASLQVRMAGCILAGANQFRQLILELLAGHIAAVWLHGRAS